MSGFGPFRDTVTCRLTCGVNTLIARNEAGKSSLVAGLMATIFGLPAKSDPGEFGHRRFKNWYGPSRFEGELEFEADGTVYKIWRDFESHKISLSVFDNGKQKNLVSGEHNPLATKRNVEYEKWLKELFGIMSRELFESTFCVTQPLPESLKKGGQGQKELTEDVQELLSGTGVAFARAQDVLFLDLKKHTRFTRERLSIGSNQRTDGELERIDERIAKLSTSLGEAKRIADSLEVVRRRLSSLQVKLDAKAAELKSKQDTRNALAEWKRLKSEYDQAVHELTRVKKAREEAESLESEITKESEELRSLYPEFENAPESIDRDLDALIALRQELTSLSETISQMKSQLDARKEEKKKLEIEVSSLRDWGKLGSTPEAEVRNRRRIASDLMDEWEKFERDMAEQAECEKLLNGELNVIDKATAEERGALENYEANLARLEKEKSEAWQRLQEVETKIRDSEKSRLEFSEKYQDLESLPDDALSILGKKLQLMRSIESESNKAAELKKKLSPPLWARVGLALIFALLGWAIGRLEPIVSFGMGQVSEAVGTGSVAWIPIVIAAALGVTGWFVAAPIWALAHPGVRKEEQEASSSIAAFKSEMEEIDASLGEQVSSADEMELGRLQERLSQRNREKMLLSEKEKGLPSEEERKEAEDASRKAQKKYDEFMQLTAMFRELFPDISAAYAKWNHVKARRAEAAKRASAFAMENFGCDLTAVHACAVLSEGVSSKWREVAELVGVTAPEEDIDTVGKLVEFLRNADDTWWTNIQGESEKYEMLQRQAEQLSTLIREGEANLSRRQDEEKQKYEHYDDISSTLKPILDAAGGDPKLAKERWSSLREGTFTLEKKKEVLKKTLSDHKVKSLDELNTVVTKCEMNALGAENRWEKLIQEKPGLPQKQAADDPERVDRHVRALDAAIENLENEVAKLQGERTACLDELRDLERENPINIAQAELELEAMMARRERIRLQADALTLAYLELNEAIREFHASHRIRLEEAAMKYFERITGIPGRVVIIDDDFKVRLDVNGENCDIAQLSKGAQDQLYIALRLAIADLLSADINLPLIFDDPFVTSDSERLDKIGAALSHLGRERQIIVLSHNEDLRNWGVPVVLEHS